VETYNNGSPTPEFNNAGQIFNHDFYWESISPEKRELLLRSIFVRIPCRVVVVDMCPSLKMSAPCCHKACFGRSHL
jgi:hypothetical protein